MRRFDGFLYLGVVVVGGVVFVVLIGLGLRN